MINKFLKNVKSLGYNKVSSMPYLNHLRSLQQIRRMEVDLRPNQKSQPSQEFRNSQRLYGWKLKHQVLLLTIIIIVSVTGMLIALNQLHFTIFASLLSDGFTQILQQQNQNFQSSVMLKYMSLTRTYFYNDQQMLLAINQIYNHALQSEYSIDKGEQCAIFREDGKYLTFQYIDLFCYCPFGQTDLVNYQDTQQHEEFVKFQNILSQFVLSFQFHLSYGIKNYIQINLDDEEEMISVYPQSRASIGYSPKHRPFYIFQKQQYDTNQIKEFYVSKYLKWYNVVGGTLYGQTLTVSLLNETEFQGVAAVSIQFSVFDQIFQSFPDVNLALVASDGTLLFQQTQFQIYNKQQYIYNQSSTGYNYLDWVYLSSYQDYKKSVLMNNTLFPEPIKVNIGQFGDLPYYFVVYNNLTYENQIKTIQEHILYQITDAQHSQLLIFAIIVVALLVVCYFPIELVMQPIKLIQRVIYSYEQNFKQVYQLDKLLGSNNMLYILFLAIYLKYSELQNLSFQKSIQCEEIEDRKYPFKKYQKNAYNKLIIYIKSNEDQLENLASTNELMKNQSWSTLQES